MLQFKSNNQKVLTFKQWTNKSWAVFKSLHQVVRIGTLCTVYSLLNLPAQAQADQDTLRIDRTIEMDEVEITGESAPFIFSQEARVVSVISREEIESAPAQSLQELIEYALNVDLRTRGGNDIQADLSLRGGSFEQTLILLNGVNVSDPQTGHLSLNLPIDLENIERIEILHGPAARVFGSNAFSGAVNFITGTNEQNHVSANISYADHNTYKGGVGLTLNTSKVRHYISASVKGSDGYIDNTDYKGHNLFYQSVFNSKLAKVDLQAGYNAKDFGALNFYSPTYKEQYEENKAFFGSVKADFGKRIKLTPTLYWRQHRDHFVLFRENPEWYQNFHISNVKGAKLRGTTTSKLGKTSFGAEFRSESIISNNLGAPTDDSIAVQGYDGYYYNKSDNRNHLSVFLDHSVYLKHFTVSGGFMLHKISDQKELGFYPGADLSYKVNDKFKVFASVNRSMRMPSFTDLYYTSPANRGNADLRPEHSLTYELGAKYNKGFLNAHVAVFERRGTDIIDWVYIPEEEIWHTENISVLNTRGLEMALNFKFKQKYSNPVVTQFNVNYSYIDVKNATEGYETKYALDNLKHKLSMSLNHKIYKSLSMTWKASYQDRNGEYLAYDEDGNSSQKEYDPFTVVDTRLSWERKVYTLYVEATNLLDTKYNDFGNVTQPGRWIKAGAKFKLNL
jgi:iron complex outermembrane receptor protein